SHTFGSTGQHRQRHASAFGCVRRVCMRARGQDDPTGALERIPECPVVPRTTSPRKGQIEEDALSARFAEFIRKSSVLPPRPRPPPDLAQRFVVDLYED